MKVVKLGGEKEDTVFPALCIENVYNKRLNLQTGKENRNL